jgi:hypothetical protein
MTARPPGATSLVSTAVVGVLLSGIGAFEARAQAARLLATIHADSTLAPIFPVLYGMFLEHIGGRRIRRADRPSRRRIATPYGDLAPPPLVRHCCLHIRHSTLTEGPSCWDAPRRWP